MTHNKSFDYLISTFVIVTAVTLILAKPLPSINAVDYNVLVALILLTIHSLYYSFCRRGFLSQEILSYLPFPLLLIKAQDKLEVIKTYVLPAVDCIFKLVESLERACIFEALKLSREYFAKELSLEKKGVKDLNSIIYKLQLRGLYSSLNNNNNVEKKNRLEALSSLILWVFRARSLTAHAASYELDALDAFLAVRTTLKYINDAYPLNEAMLYTRCPYCGTINVTKVTKSMAKWNKMLSVKCKECKKEYKVKLTPKVIREHYNILASIEAKDT